MKTKPVLISFFVRSVVDRILRLTISQKTVGICLLVVFANAIDPVGNTLLFLSLPPLHQAPVISLLSTLWIAASNPMFRQISVSDEISLLRSMPIGHGELIRAMIASYYIVNLTYACAFGFVLSIATGAAGLPWWASVAAFFTGTVGMTFGQINYAISSYESFPSRFLCLFVFFSLFAVFWFSYCVSGTHWIGYCFFAFFVLAGGYRSVTYRISRYPQKSWIRDPRSPALILLRGGALWKLMKVYYLCLWRQNRSIFISRLALVLLITGYAIVCANNTSESLKMVRLFILSGSTLSVMIFGSSMISGRFTILPATDNTAALPFRKYDRLLADHLSVLSILVLLVPLYGFDLFFVQGIKNLKLAGFIFGFFFSGSIASLMLNYLAYKRFGGQSTTIVYLFSLTLIVAFGVGWTWSLPLIWLLLFLVVLGNRSRWIYLSSAGA
jgi:hypothetical protein